jgi:steroid delta-isomerase-like uncharacterized protein
MSSTRENKDIVLRKWYEEIWNNWNVSAADELFSSDYVLHVSGVPAPLNRDAAKQVVTMFGTAFPDLRHTVDEMVAEDNAVVARWSVLGTHRGDFQGIAATGRLVRLSGTTVHHMSEGKIVETWLTLDNLDLLQQLGALPQPGQV